MRFLLNHPSKANIVHTHGGLRIHENPASVCPLERFDWVLRSRCWLEPEIRLSILGMSKLVPRSELDFNASLGCTSGNSRYRGTSFSRTEPPTRLDRVSKKVSTRRFSFFVVSNHEKHGSVSEPTGNKTGASFLSSGNLLSKRRERVGVGGLQVSTTEAGVACWC